MSCRYGSTYGDSKKRVTFAKLGVINDKCPDIVTEAVRVQFALEIDSISNTRRQCIINGPVILVVIRLIKSSFLMYENLELKLYGIRSSVQLSRYSFRLTQ